MEEYKKVISELKTLNHYLSLTNSLASMGVAERLEAVRYLIMGDLFFLLYYGLNRKDVFNQWILDRCKEVQANPNGRLDLWARGHYKSTIITLALTIQDILNSPEDTFGIFSCTRPIAKQFLRQIKREFESNETLRYHFPDILYENPSRDAPKWSEDDGIIVKRVGNPKEATVEAWGIVEGQPISKHFNKKIYDDLITLEYVSTPEMIEKVTMAWSLSLNLGSTNCVDRYIGTRYHFADTYKTMMDRGTVIPRIHSATDDGTFDGKPVYMTREKLDQKCKDMGSYVFSSQMLQNPIADTTMGFKRENIRYHEGLEDTNDGMNNYILVDPANAKTKKSDYTAIWVVALNSDQNYYIKAIVRDKLNLKERTDIVIDLHKRFRPLGVAYEQYGKDSDIQHIESEQARLNYRFDITAVGGRVSKPDRIRRLIPLFEQHRIWLPQTCFRTNYEKKTEDLVNVFIEQEYLPFPVPLHDDMLDSLARICEESLSPLFPRPKVQPKKDGWATSSKASGSWRTA